MAAIQLRTWLQPVYGIITAEPGERCSGCKQLLHEGRMAIGGRYRHMDKPHLFGPVVEWWHDACWDLVMGPKLARVGTPQPGSWKENGMQPFLSVNADHRALRGR